jgi:predicted RNA-binding Zn ribbon-like protein
MSRESRKFKVPEELANLYDFANSLDLRHFTHHGVQHVPGDAFTGPRELEAWMAARGLMSSGLKITPAMLEAARQLRAAVRAFLQSEPAARRNGKAVLQTLNQAMRMFPLLVEAAGDGSMKLRPAHDDATAGLAAIIAELHQGAASGALDRLKTCAADECRRVFFDRSKPGTRRWCDSTLCGNRIKTRTYRQRHQGAADG